MSFDEIIDLLRKHLQPKQNVLVAQHKFLCIYQTEDQSISDFVTRLRASITDCEFVSTCNCNTSVADIFLRAQFIRGLYDNDIRGILLQKTDSFENIVSKAISIEAAKIDSRQLSNKMVAQQHPPTINRVSQRSGSRHRSKSRNLSQSYRNKSKRRIDYASLGIDGLCLRCGRNNHHSKECYTIKSNLKCALCQLHGHVAKVCIKSLLNRKVNKSNQITSENSEVNQIVNIIKNRTDDRFFTTVLIENQPVKFEIDSGSGFTFIPRDQFAKLNIKLPLQYVNLTF